MPDELTNGSGGDSEDQSPTPEEIAEENARLKAALKSANSESATRRHKLKDYEEAERLRLEADMSERDKLAKQLADEKDERVKLAAQLQTQTVRGVIVTAATKLGFTNPEDAYKLVAAEASIEVTDDGSVKGFEKPLEELAKSGRLVMGDQAVVIGTPASARQRSGGQRDEADGPTPRLRI